ncbi:hypothetical protein BpHYR1_029485 [Brachionus plicatilis]|uniref:Uncharacterized protein n=1 Tax=Brachionus plicatilis TaxID=10195 RepID=A0A3M7S2N5_BRAPC|nr:hypothetical protein BpHYR1_029485 [Brachionus plicatilis]
MIMQVQTLAIQSRFELFEADPSSLRALAESSESPLFRFFLSFNFTLIHFYHIFISYLSFTFQNNYKIFLESKSQFQAFSSFILYELFTFNF